MVLEISAEFFDDSADFLLFPNQLVRGFERLETHRLGGFSAGTWSRRAITHVEFCSSQCNLPFSRSELLRLGPDFFFDEFSSVCRKREILIEYGKISYTVQDFFRLLPVVLVAGQRVQLVYWERR